MKLESLKAWTHLLVATLALVTPSIAWASSGFVTGALRFHQKNGNYCPTGSDCLGARYRSGSWDVQAGIPEAQVRLQTTSGTLISSSFTSANGTYSIAWSFDTNGSAAGMGTADLDAVLVVYFRNKDNAYGFRSFANVGSKVNYVSSGTLKLIHGKTSASPQTAAMSWGTSASPGRIANAYWAAYMVDRYVLRGLARFTNVDILGFDVTGTTAKCPSSCAAGAPLYQSNAALREPYEDQMLTVVLDGEAGTPYWPIERTMHELGHIGDFVSVQGGHARSTEYDYNDPGVRKWGQDTQEYRPTALTEGLASFIGVAGLYSEIATAPMTCWANGNAPDAFLRHCYDTMSVADFNLEESHDGSCAAKEGRLPISAARYMWDIFDNVADGSDNIDLSEQTILTTMSTFPCSNYPACYADGNLHDQFSSVSSANNGIVGWSVSAAELDDGNGWHWRTALVNSGGTDVTNAFTRNCMGFW